MDVASVSLGEKPQVFVVHRVPMHVFQHVKKRAAIDTCQSARSLWTRNRCRAGERESGGNDDRSRPANGYGGLGAEPLAAHRLRTALTGPRTRALTGLFGGIARLLAASWTSLAAMVTC